MASHLEQLIAEYHEWKGYLVRRNVKVGRRPKGGWEMELDVVAYHPEKKELLHFEPSLDAMSWEKRRARYAKKLDAGRQYIFKEVFPWLPSDTKLRQVAIFIRRPKTAIVLEGATILSVDELVAKIRRDVIECGIMAKNAISEHFPLLRTIQLSHVGYYGVVEHFAE